MLAKLVQVLVLLRDAPLELLELLLLAHADGVVLVCLFALAECVSVFTDQLA